MSTTAHRDLFLRACRRVLRSAALLFLALAAPALCAGFGKNKVHYTGLDWSVYKGPYYHIYTHQDQGPLPELSYRLAADAYEQLAADFRFTHRKPVPIVVYHGAHLFQQTNVVPDIIPEGVGGFTEMFKNRVVLPWAGSYAEYRHVLHHELVHAFQFGVLYDRIGGSFLRNAGLQLPLWFAEGLAEYLSSGWDSEADMFLMDRVITGELASPGPELNGYMAYKGGQSFLLFLSSAYGDSLFSRFLRNFRSSRVVETALETTYRMSIESLSDAWKQQVRRLYWPEIALRRSPADFADCITAKHFKRATYNLRPRISPDGSRIAFFSDKRDYTRIFVVDSSGAVVASVPQQGYGGYFETFHPFRSGLCWSPDGRQLAFVSQRAGRDEIRIVDVESRSLVRVVSLPGLSAVVSPDWSPDGSRLVFCGLAHGRSDLYLYSLTDSSLTALTSDIAFESDPVFSPSGRRIVYTLEDTTGQLCLPNRTHPGRRNASRELALRSLDGTATRLLTATPWHEGQARFSGEDSLVFVSDRNGIDNVYRGPLDSLAAARPLTDFLGGCSSPDWNADSSTLVFTLFQKGSWRIYRMLRADTVDLGDSLVPTRWAHHLADSTFPFIETAARRDTLKAPTGRRDTTLAHRRDTTLARDTALADTARLDTAALRTLPAPDRYRLRFSPDILAFGLGASSLYGYAGEWFAMFSDLMGDHRFTLAGDIAGRLDEYVHLFGSYVNARQRLSFGAGAFYGRHYTLLGSLYHDTYVGAIASASYPFTSRSRLDFDCYYSYIERRAKSSLGESRTFDVLLPTLAHVYDNVVWGLTGPVNGLRTRVSATVAPPLERIDAAFGSMELDARRYFHFGRRFVLATRLSAGASFAFDGSRATRRYILGGSEYWFNYRINVDGYDDNLENVFYSDMVVPFRGWYYYDLAGSRYAVVNAEFRFPFVKEVSIVWPLPLRLRYVNGAVFVDAGNAWDADEEPYGELPLPSDIYGGIGFGLRANLGVFVLRYDRAWRTDWRTFVNRPVTYWSLGADF